MCLEKNSVITIKVFYKWREIIYFYTCPVKYPSSTMRKMITKDASDIKEIINFYEEFCANKLENLDKMDEFLKYKM